MEQHTLKLYVRRSLNLNLRALTRFLFLFSIWDREIKLTPLKVLAIKQLTKMFCTAQLFRTCPGLGCKRRKISSCNSMDACLIRNSKNTKVVSYSANYFCITYLLRPIGAALAIFTNAINPHKT
jgi:hypothetical protein